MFRYICPVILAGGMSDRFGENKVFFNFKDFSFLDYRLNFLFDIGFLNVNVSGSFKGYSSIRDFIFAGSIGGVFTCMYVNFCKKISHILFVPVDTTYFNKIIFFNLFFKSNFFFSYIYRNVFFPFLISISLSSFEILLYFCLDCNFFNLSFFMFFEFILLKKIYIEFFYKKYFFNLNTYYNLFLYFK